MNMQKIITLSLSFLIGTGLGLGGTWIVKTQYMVSDRSLTEQTLPPILQEEKPVVETEQAKLEPEEEKPVQKEIPQKVTNKMSESELERAINNQDWSHVGGKSGKMAKDARFRIQGEDVPELRYKELLSKIRYRIWKSAKVLNARYDEQGRVKHAEIQVEHVEENENTADEPANNQE